jgi:hypothetical protein
MPMTVAKIGFDIDRCLRSPIGSTYAGEMLTIKSVITIVLLLFPSAATERLATPLGLTVVLRVLRGAGRGEEAAGPVRTLRR